MLEGLAAVTVVVETTTGDTGFAISIVSKFDDPCPTYAYRPDIAILPSAPAAPFAVTIAETRLGADGLEMSYIRKPFSALPEIYKYFPLTAIDSA